MSATLGGLRAQAGPDRRVRVVERLDEAGCESSAAENNAGTGHAGLCEFDYTPRGPDGNVDPGAAVLIAGQFAASLVFWARLVERGELSPCRSARSRHSWPPPTGRWPGPCPVSGSWPTATSGTATCTTT